MPIKASIHLQSLQQWPQPQMLPLIKINLGLLTVENLIMSQLVSISSASLSHTPLKIILLLVMDKTYLLLILVLFLFHLLSLIFNLIMSSEYP